MRMREAFEAYLDHHDQINVYMANTFFGGESRFFHLKNERDEILPLTIQQRSSLPNGYVHYVLKPEEPLEVGQEYMLHDEHCKSVPLKYSHIVKTEPFAKQFTYDKDNLGTFVSGNETTFRIWAPTASKVQLRLEQGEDSWIVDMERKDKGVYERTLPENLHGTRYVYQVRVNGAWHTATDPYTFFSGPDSRYSVVVDMDQVDLPEKVEMPVLERNTDAIIYETSIRDMTAQYNSGHTHPKTFEAFVEENEETITRRTGLSYLKDLGVTHIQLMPVFDFGSVDETHPDLFYNWGYDPVQFRALEGSYSTDPNNAQLRVEEFARLVHKLHQNGLKVVLDLVFNHVYDRDQFSLENLVPYYYFLMNENGEFSNGSFCGNDIDTRQPMSRKYFVDTCRKIVELFDVDGFRFDLMGILDIDTMNEIASACRKMKPGFMIYGEGWDMPSFVPPELRASQQNQGKMPLVGHFSDRFREVVRGSNGNLGQKGFSSGDTGNLEEVKQVLTASCKDSRFDSPQKVVNYVECHDNHTLWDKNRYACRSEGREMREKRQVMANALVLLSQGIPFLHSGQEFGRTKQDRGNTYNAPDNINQVDYQRRDRHATIVKDTIALINIRKAHPAFRLADVQSIWDNVSFETLDGQCLVYRVQKEEDKLAVFFNPTGSYFQYEMKEPGTVIFDNGESNSLDSGNLIIAPYSVVIYQIES